LTSALEGGEESASRPGHTLPPGKTRYPLYRRLGGSQVRSGHVPKISPPPGFEHRTVQPVGSRYTDYATRPTVILFKDAIPYERQLEDQCRIRSRLCHTEWPSVSSGYTSPVARRLNSDNDVGWRQHQLYEIPTEFHTHR
jgi:hypothetical protein